MRYTQVLDAKSYRMDISTTEKHVTLDLTHNDNFELFPLHPFPEKTDCDNSEHPNPEDTLINMPDSIENINENTQGTVMLVCSKVLSIKLLKNRLDKEL